MVNVVNGDKSAGVFTLIIGSNTLHDPVLILTLLPVTVKLPSTCMLPKAVVVTPAVPKLVSPANVVIFGWLALELFNVPYRTALALPIVAAFTVVAITLPVNVTLAPLITAPALPIVAAFTALAIIVPLEVTAPTAKLVNVPTLVIFG